MNMAHDPQWMLETSENTKLCMHHAFTCAYIPMISLNQAPGEISNSEENQTGVTVT